MRYLIGVNEPYSEFQSNLRVRQVTNIYKRNLVPAATKLNLTLVAPAVGIGDRALNWLAEFLVDCVGVEDCDHRKIRRFNFHFYSCKESKWRRKLEVESGVLPPLYKDLKTKILAAEKKVLQDDSVDLEFKNRLKDMNWTSYLRDKRAWITETNCNDDVRNDNIDQSSSFQACEKAAGESDDQRYGNGSLQAMSELELVEKVAWWTTYIDLEKKISRESGQGKIVDEADLQKTINKIKSAVLLNDDGTLTPMGNAYKNFSPDNKEKLCTK